jgi:hypothetical protein
MKKATYLFVMLFALGLLAACAPNEPVAESAADANRDSEMADEAMVGEPMADEAMADEAMADEAMADEAMADEAMADEAMADEDMADEDMVHEEMAGDDTGSDEHMDEAAMEDQAADASSMESEQAMIDLTALPAWQQIGLTNARTGEPFTLTDFLGKTLYVEPMATWCTNCLRQLHNVREARAQAGDDSVFLALSLETNIDDAALAQYADDNGFDWLFAVMTPEMLQELAGAFGRSVTVAPSTPHFIVRPDGSHTDLLTGFESATQILQSIQAAQG